MLSMLYFIDFVEFLKYQENTDPRTRVVGKQDIPFRDYKDVISQLISTIEFKMG